MYTAANLYDSENSFLRPPICVIPDALNMYISRKTKLAQFKIQNVVKDLTDFLIQTHFPGVLFSSDSCNSSKWIRQFQFKPIETVWCEIIFESVVLYFQQMIKLRVHPTTDTKVYSEVLIMQTPPPAPQHTHTQIKYINTNIYLYTYVPTWLYIFMTKSIIWPVITSDKNLPQHHMLWYLSLSTGAVCFK